ncbi:MAG: type I-D CRISPR-associated protein Cas5/Csc1 [Caldilineaceae bacterium]
MHITTCQLTLHENLFYATREIGRLYETGRYLHNYGLTYALEFAIAPYFNNNALPRYAEELGALNLDTIYVTPARPLAVEFELNTFKYADNRYRVKMELGSRNTPSFGRAKELATGSTFQFAILSTKPLVRLPGWIRLGKWMSKAELTSKGTECAEQKHGYFTSDFPLNPLDLPSDTRLLTYDLISMPPVSLVDQARLHGAYYLFGDKRCIPAGLAYRFSLA